MAGTPPSLFLLGRWKGVGKVFSCRKRLEPAIHYVEEFEVSRQGPGMGQFWYHRQTWKVDPADEEQKKVAPTHVESGVFKLLPTPEGEPQKVEAFFIHPFGVSELSTGTLTKDGSKQVVSLAASAAKGQFLRGTATGEKKILEFTRQYEYSDDEPSSLRYKCGLQSDAMPELWEHLECELTWVE